MCRTDFWTLLEKARVGWSERIALKYVYYQLWNTSPVQVWCMRQVLRTVTVSIVSPSICHELMWLDAIRPISAYAQNWLSHLDIHLWIRASPKTELRVSGQRNVPQLQGSHAQRWSKWSHALRGSNKKNKPLLCINTTVDFSIESGRKPLLVLQLCEVWP